jgi:hypothetical protein
MMPLPPKLLMLAVVLLAQCLRLSAAGQQHVVQRIKMEEAHVFLLSSYLYSPYRSSSIALFGPFSSVLCVASPFKLKVGAKKTTAL